MVEVREPTHSEIARLEDLSKNGLGVEVEHSIRVGSKIAVEVKSETGTRVTCIARVCHVREQDSNFHLGLQLIELRAVQRLAVDALVKVARERGQELLDLHWLD